MLQMLKEQPGYEQPRTGSSQAEESVREQYARGEIDRRQFQEMMGDLKSDVP
jgi:uncharacterized membrane protein